MRPPRSALGVAFLLAGGVAVAQAQTDEPAAPVQAEPDSLWVRDYLLGFGERRDAWEQQGIAIDLYYNGLLGWNAKGGQNTSGALKYSQSIDLFVRADFERMGLWDDGTALMQVKSNSGQNINPYVGSLAQVVDDADFTESIYIDQLYYEHHWREDTVRLRAGYLDYQTIIDRNAYANSEDLQFMNAALDNNLLVPLKIGFGATLFVEPTEWLGLIFGTADAENEILQAGWDTAFHDTDNLMAYGEATVKVGFDSARGPLPGNYRWGAFYDPLERPDFEEMRMRTGTAGTWVSLDQKLYREQDTDLQGLGFFYRYGWRTEESYAISQFHSAGFEYLGPLPSRDRDAFGVGFYDLVSSDDFEEFVNPEFTGETGIESYYRIQITPWFALSPGVQYIADPGGLESNRDSLAFVLRTRVRF